MQKFFQTGSLQGIQAMHAQRLRLILSRLNNITQIDDINLPSFRLHRLEGNMNNLWSIAVQANWRITFEFDENTKNVYIVDYQDYH